MSSILLLAFGGTKTIVGQDEVAFPLDTACSVDGLLDALCAFYPRLAPQRRALRLAVNGAYAAAGDRVAPGDEVALIPPVAGG
jgi:molybdopterin converting factor small subunit